MSDAAGFCLHTVTGHAASEQLDTGERLQAEAPPQRALASGGGLLALLRPSDL